MNIGLGRVRRNQRQSSDSKCNVFLHISLRNVVYGYTGQEAFNTDQYETETFASKATFPLMTCTAFPDHH